MSLDSSTQCRQRLLTPDCSLIDFYLKLHWTKLEHLEASLKKAWSIYPLHSLVYIPAAAAAAAAAAAKTLQLCLTLCDPIDGTSPDCSVPGTLQARTLKWAAISFSSA